MSEFGKDFGPEVDDEREESVTMEERAEEIRASCEHVYENAENASVLDRILLSAEQNHEKDPKEWDSLLEDMEDELKPVEEPDDIAVILIRFENRAKALK